MPGKAMIQRKREQHKIDRNARLTRNTENGFLTHKSMGITAKDAFRTITHRVSWLNDKIAWCQVNGMKFGLYVREREALLWMMDKVKELSKELLEVETEEKWASNAIAQGWTPPPNLWLDPSTANKQEFYLAWVVEAGEPYENGIADFFYTDGEEWYDAREEKIRSSEVKGIHKVPEWVARKG